VGLQGKDPSATKILELVGSDLNLIIPRLIAQEVTRNLTSPQNDFVEVFLAAFKAGLEAKPKK
jgi:hypothetical protein